jgi:undecaprenyl-diphosphatase
MISWFSINHKSLNMPLNLFQSDGSDQKLKAFIKDTLIKSMLQIKHWMLIFLFPISILIQSLFPPVNPLTANNSSFYEASETRIAEIFFLGFVQGVTEWFPISSSGHLVIFQELFKINVSVAFDVMLHLGTLAGVVLFLRRDLLTILKAVLKLDFSSKEGRIFIYVILATVPTALIGFLLKDVFEAMFSNFFATGIAMLVNGVILYSTKYSKPRKDLDVFDSLLIGFAQAVAITPGISRTGITVSTALLRGVEGSEAYRFSLLLSVLSIIGGSIVKLGDVNFEQESFTIILGILVAATVSYLTLRIVRKYVIRRSFHKFAYYCLLVGAFILFLSIVKLF